MESPGRLTKQLQNDVSRILRPVDMLKLSPKERALVADLRQVLGDAIIYANAFGTSETPEEIVSNSKQAKKWLNRAGKDILVLSEQDIFGAIDVAQLSAQIETIKVGLK